MLHKIGGEGGTTAATAVLDAFNAPLSMLPSFLGLRFSRAVAALALLLATTAFAAPEFVFSHLAGNTTSVGCVDGQGSAARFWGPSGIGVDEGETLYVADRYNHVIRKITAGGAVTTYAGRAGEPGEVNGALGQARFTYPGPLTVAADGTVYVMSSNTLRKITANGVVSTLAGSPGATGTADGHGSAARFNSPASLAVDTTGNVWVADTFSHTIRKVTPDGTVTTAAGTAGTSGNWDGTGTSARFSLPWGIAVGPDASVYVVDGSRSFVRKISSSGQVTTIAGPVFGETSSWGEDSTWLANSIAVGPNGEIYVGDLLGSIRRVEKPFTVTTFAGNPSSTGWRDGTGRSAQFTSVGDLAIHRSGRIYATEHTAHVVRCVTPAAVVTTLAGKPVEAGSQDGQGAAARFSNPSSLAVDASGTAWVVSGNLETLRTVSPDGFVSTRPSPSRSEQLWYGQDGALIIASGAGEVIALKSDGSTAPLAQSQPWESSLRYAHAVVDRTGNVFVADNSRAIILKFSSPYAGVIFAGAANEWGTVDGPSGVSRLRGIGGMIIDADDNLYVSETVTHVIRKITPAGMVSTFAGQADAAGSADGTGGAARFNTPLGMALDSAGRLYVADSGNHTIRLITPAGDVSTIGGKAGQAGLVDGPGASARFFRPVAVALDAARNLYVAETGNRAIRKGINLSSGLPVITAQPSSAVVGMGGSVVFSVTATGATGYQWTFNGVPISGATSATYLINGVNKAHEGTYRVSISSAEGTVQSVAVSLTTREGTPTKLINVSTRAMVGTGDDVLIAGMVIRGSTPKRVLLRAAGPALAIHELSGLLADPELSLMSGDREIASNDNWSAEPQARADLVLAMKMSGAVEWVEGSRDSALLLTLAPGSYTAIVRGKNGTTGLAMVEAYAVNADTGEADFINLSTRSLVGQGANVQIAGFVLRGETSANLLIRALGPSLRERGVPNPLANPEIELYRGQTRIATNDDYGTSTFPPSYSPIQHGALQATESAIHATLAPGLYTVVVRGKDGSAGAGLIELYW
jgi:hypothetical protein